MRVDALVNALAQATGHRARRLPLEPFPRTSI
jgi:CO/xanthine dehydrogenase Mo-binding subunit